MTRKRTPAEHKQAFKNSDDAFRLLFLNHPVPMWIYDLETLAFLEVNDAAVRRYGYSRDEFLAMTLTNIRPPEDVPRLLENVARAPEGFEESGEWRHRLKDGRVIDVAITSHTLVFMGRKAKLVSAEGITERRQAEEALRDRTAQLEMAVRAAGLGVWRLDLQSGIVTMHQGAGPISGLPDGTSPATTEAFFALIHPDDRGHVSRQIQRAVEEREEYRAEFRILPPGGTVRWVVVTGRCFYDAAGKPLVLTGVDVDITERKQADAALRESEERFRKVFEEGPLGMVMASVGDGRFLRANAVFCQMVGYTEEELKRLTFENVTCPEHRAADVEAVKRLWQGQIPQYKTEKRYLKKNGETLWGALTASLIRSDDGKPLYSLATIEDISTRKLAEEALRAERDRLARIAATAPGVICSFRLRPDGSADFPYASPASQDVFGFTPEALAQDASMLLPLVHPDDAGHVSETMAASARTMSPWRQEYRHKHPEKGEIWIAVHSMPGREPDGSTVWHGFVADITERKRAEEAMRQSETLSRNLVWHLPQRIFIKDRSSAYLFCNSNFALDLGIGPEQIVGKDDFAFFPRELAEQYRADDREVMAEGKIRDISERYKVAGEERWVHTLKIPYRDEHGEIVGVLGIFEDITDRKRDEAALRLQSAALNAAANAMVITERDGTIAWINPAFTALTGYSDEEALGRNMRALVKSGVHDDAFYKNLWDTILAGHVWRCGDMTNRRKDGSLYQERQTITPVKDARGAVTHFIAIKRDLTEQRHLEAQLNQAQRMESVGRLAGGVAHDFNNLLTVINNYAQLAAAELKAGDPLHEMLQEIEGAGQRAAALTRQLLAFSRRQVVQPVVFDLNGVVADMENMLRRLIGEDVALVVVPANHGGRVKADPGQIEQVIMNLAVNARDAMPAGGTLTIEIANVELDEAYVAQHAAVHAGPYVMLAISDTGVGMDEATRERVFEPFFTTKGADKGTGLGLSTVYGIVTQSGGSVWVYSEVGEGSTFKIYLPRVEEAALEARPPRPLASARGTETILLVEDETTVRVLARRILESAGYRVLPAANGGEALLLLERFHEPVHMMMTDVVMPGMSGPELAQRLGAVRPGMKVLYTSGYTDDEVVRRGILSDAVRFINKPYSVSELTGKVREVLDQPA